MAEVVAAGNGHAGRAAAHAMYALYAVSLFTGVPMFIGAIIAYVGRGDARPLYRTHLSWGITTFWVTLIIGIIGFLLTFVVIGWLVLGVLWLWTAYRIIRGWMRLIDERAAPG